MIWIASVYLSQFLSVLSAHYRDLVRGLTVTRLPCSTCFALHEASVLLIGCSDGGGTGTSLACVRVVHRFKKGRRSSTCIQTNICSVASRLSSLST